MATVKELPVPAVGSSGGTCGVQGTGCGQRLACSTDVQPLLGVLLARCDPVRSSQGSGAAARHDIWHHLQTAFVSGESAGGASGQGFCKKRSVSWLSQCSALTSLGRGTRDQQGQRDTGTRQKRHVPAFQADLLFQSPSVHMLCPKANFTCSETRWASPCSEQ